VLDSAPDGMRTCSKCGLVLPATTEFFCRHSEGYLRRQCRSCRNKLVREYFVRKPEKRAQYWQKTSTRDGFVERRKTYSAEYYEGHKEELRERARKRYADNREQCLATRLEWGRNHREYVSATRRNRWAQQKESTGTHTAEDIEAQYRRQRGKCYWRNVNDDCSVSLKGGYHVDHVVPLSKGGSNGPENLVLACPTCNLQKHAKHPMDWAGVLF
jgi:5-methylcytosine-specific restriction endonuclease McrA